MIKKLFKKPPGKAKQRWRKLPKDDYHKAESFLKAREEFCVAACARFLRIRENRGHVWFLPNEDDEISAILLHSRRSLLPVFEEKNNIPSPRFLSRFLGKVNIHAIQGLSRDAELLEALMEAQGYFASEHLEYDLMSLDCAANETSSGLKKNPASKPGPAGLILRSPMPEDEEALFALQSAYEQEEVLPENAAFNPAACRLNLQNILSRESVLVAELEGQVVGKINTSAESFTRYQIGGVYVRPDCRGLGIGLKMTRAFIQTILSRGRAITLFVKKRNLAACRVYRKIGFKVLADYRITYY
jgi:hypothetical protein